MTRRLISAWCLLLCGGSFCVSAQVLYGSMVGNVQDPSNAQIPEALVVITHKETRQSRQASTNDSGAYSFTSIPSGVYAVKVSKAGFAAASINEVSVTINNTARANVTLQLGSVAETVLVTSQSPLLQTDRSEVRSEVTSKTLENVPVPLGRNYQQVFRSLPGFSSPGNAHSIPSNPARALTFNVNGSSRSSNNTRIDGASSTNVQLPWIVAYVPSLESIETVNVVTNSFDAEQGLAGGAAISVQTKSGSNNLHGSIFEYHTNNKLKAKAFFLPPGERNPKLVNNQFGGTIGGPIRRDKLFYFLAYEGTLDRQNAARFSTVPTAAIKRGDMSESPRAIYDPLTGDVSGANRTAFVNNIVPIGRISSISRKIADLTPLPNLPGLANNYYSTTPFLFDRHTLDTKVNWNPTDKLTMFTRYGMLDYISNNPQVFGDGLGGPPISAFGGNPGRGAGNTFSLTTAVTYLFTPTFLMDAYFGWTKANTDSEQARLDEKVGSDILGIPGTNGNRRIKGGWPRFIIDTYTNLGINEDFMPYYKRDPQYQYVANFNWTKGTHNVRFGMDVYRQGMNQIQEQFTAGAFHGGQGGFTFGGGPTSTRGGASPNQFNSYATFLLGLPTNKGKVDLIPEQYTVRAQLYSGYIRDRWNPTTRLTVSYGTRWEYFPVATRADRGLERYDASTNQMLICGVGVVPRDCGIKVSKRMLSPRLGIAWRATDTFVVRAGYGITNDPFVITEPMRANYPVLIPLNLEGPNSFQPVGRLEDGIPSIKVPEFGNGIISVPGTVALATPPDNIRRGYVQSWNFTLQKELTQGLTAQAGYVATRQTRQFGFLDLNAGQIIGAGQSGRPLLQKFGRTAATNQVFTPLGTGQYNSLQASLQRRFAQGLQLSANYTWSKAIGITDNSENNPRVQALQYFDMNRTLVGYDRTHNVQITSIWELPFGKGRRWVTSGIGSALLGGWQVNNLLSFMSGTPYSLAANGASLDLPGSTQRADQVKAKVDKLGKIGRGSSYFDPLAFAPVTAARFGNAGYNSMRGPGVANWDFGIFREFISRERLRVQFRVESFNFSNTPHFSNPAANVSNLSLNGDGSIRALGGYSEVTSTSSMGREGVDERQFRFGLRLSF